MEIIINGTEKEIADLVLGIQSQQIVSNVTIDSEAVLRAIRGKALINPRKSED